MKLLEKLFQCTCLFVKEDQNLLYFAALVIVKQVYVMSLDTNIAKKLIV